LNSPSRVTQIEEVAFAHIAVRGDTARRPKILAFFEFFAHLCDGSARLESSAEWVDSFGAKGG
jgi:hypothetical protein